MLIALIIAIGNMPLIEFEKNPSKREFDIRKAAKGT